MSGNALVMPLIPQVENVDHEMALRRAAVLVTATLPVDLDDALRVLELARGLVTDFLRPTSGGAQAGRSRSD